MKVSQIHYQYTYCIYVRIFLVDRRLYFAILKTFLPLYWCLPFLVLKLVTASYFLQLCITKSFDIALELSGCKILIMNQIKYFYFIHFMPLVSFWFLQGRVVKQARALRSNQKFPDLNPTRYRGRLFCVVKETFKKKLSQQNIDATLGTLQLL